MKPVWPQLKLQKGKGDEKKKRKWEGEMKEFANEKGVSSLPN